MKSSNENLILQRNSFDSLDLDTSANYITSNFPKNVRDTIYNNSLKSQWQIIKSTFDHDSAFDAKYFTTLAANSGYIRDTSEGDIVFIKSEFNKRLSLMLSFKPKRKLTYQIQCVYWFDRKKYIVILIFEYPVHLTRNTKLSFIPVD